MAHGPGIPSAQSRTAWTRHGAPAATGEAGAQLQSALAAGSLVDAFEAGVAAHPRATLGVDETVLTLAQTLHRARRWASVLRARGAMPGTRLIICAGSGMDMVTAYLAALVAGCPVVLSGPASTSAELDRVIDQSGATAVIADRRREARLPVWDLAELAAAAHDVHAHPGHRVRSEDIAVLAFTSGTTGRPKVVPLTHGMLLASMRAVQLAWDWSPEDRLVHALPLYHQHGLGGVHASFLAGTSAHLLSSFDPVQLARTVREFRATVLFSVPTMYQRLLEVADRVRGDLSGLRLATSGSAPLSAGLAERIHAELGLQPLERYGLTESGLDVSNLSAGPRLVGSVGYPLPGVELAVVDEAGQHRATGDEGEIVLRGPQVFEGYLDDPQATATAFFDQGWFRTGDLGRLDASGALRITGRLKDLVITGGMNVSPVEVEDVLESFPGVREAAVTGIPHELWGEQVAAWVVTEGAVDLDRLADHCKDQLASFKCPKQTFVVDSLPRNAMGKIVRSQLTPQTA